MGESKKDGRATRDECKSMGSQSFTFIQALQKGYKIFSIHMLLCFFSPVLLVLRHLFANPLETYVLAWMLP